MTRLLPLLLLLACGDTGSHGHDDHGDEHGHDDHGDEHGHEGHGSEVHLTEQALQAARLTIAPATEDRLARELSLPARVTLDPRKEAVLSAWIEGQITSIAVRTGDTVARGDTLANVQSPDIGGAVADFRAAEARDEAADARLERLRSLEKDGVASRAQVLQAEAEHAEAMGALEAAEERLRILGVDQRIADPHAGGHYPSVVPIRSPIAGRVFHSEVAIGQRVAPGDVLFHVGDIGEIWMILDVYEQDLQAVSTGQSVSFTVQAWPGEVFEGRVDQVSDWVDPDARTVELRVIVPNEAGRLKPNMFATATLTVPSTDPTEGVVLPATAVQDLEGRTVVFVEQSEEPRTFAVRDVVIADRNSANVRLASGVAAGEPVVVEGAFTLLSELRKEELGGGHDH